MVTQNLSRQILTLAKREQVVSGSSPTSLGILLPRSPPFLMQSCAQWLPKPPSVNTSGLEFDLYTFLPPSPADKPTFIAFRAKSRPARISSECQNFIFDSAVRNSLQCAPSNWNANYFDYISFQFPFFQPFQHRWIFITFIVVLKTTTFGFW